METVLSKIAEQSITVAAVLVMYYYQRADKEKFMDLQIENVKVIQSLQFAIEKLSDRLSNLKGN